jgi:hypothetical protein
MWYDGKSIRVVEPSHTKRHDSYAIQQLLDVQQSIPNTDEIVSQLLNDPDGLRLLDRGLVLGNQDRLLRLYEDASVGLIRQWQVGGPMSARYGRIPAKITHSRHGMTVRLGEVSRKLGS